MPTAIKSLIMSLVVALLISSPGYSQSRIQLRRGWQLQSSCKVKDGGESISRTGFSTAGWHYAEVPTTVVAALVADKTYPDPYYGMNLNSFPGMDYSSKEFFANEPMPADSPFRCSWWFRTEFSISKPAKSENFALHLDGINYRGDIWMNGKKIAGKEDVAGTFRIFEFDVTAALHEGRNALAVEVTAPTERDLAITWVDWNPTPPDKDMGLWKDVYITTSNTVTLRHPFIRSQL